ncbi:MAG TPA: hypothetical protein VFI11_15435 [Anaerolineales bacterium]|nr:hypothetical protein [Anaerolineales bacterium]
MDESRMTPTHPEDSGGQGGRMRSSIDLRLVWGLGLVVLGGLLLLQNLDILRGGGILWAVLVGLLGAALLIGLIQDRSRWWLAIPGITLLGLSATIALGDLLPTVASVFGGGLFLASIGLSFVVVYLLRQDFWWAIIPAGTLISLAMVTAVGDRLGGFDSGAILFLGLAVTFLILALLPEGRGRQAWAVFPAAGLGIVALLAGAAFGSAARIFWPAALIALGLVFILRTIRRRPAG